MLFYEICHETKIDFLTDWILNREQPLENMSCVSNADAIEDDLSIVDNSFCPAAHDQVDVIPSLGFASDYEYSNGKLIHNLWTVTYQNYKFRCH